MLRPLLTALLLAGCNGGAVDDDGGIAGTFTLEGGASFDVEAWLDDDGSMTVSGSGAGRSIDLDVPDASADITWNAEAPDGPLDVSMTFVNGEDSYREDDLIWFVWTPQSDSFWTGGIRVVEGEYHTVRVGSDEVEADTGE